MKHEHEILLPSGGYGPAMDCIEENELGEFWISNDEYSSRVNFCPICGVAAPKQITKFREHQVGYDLDAQGDKTEDEIQEIIESCL